MVEYGHKIEEKVKNSKCEIKENVKGTNSVGKETRTQANGLDQKEKITIQQKQNEDTRIQKKKKNQEKLRNLQDNLKYSNIWITGVPEGEEEQQEIENLFEQIMKENFPNMVKEVQGLSGSPRTSESA